MPESFGQRFFGDKEEPPHDGYRVGGKSRGGRHADRGGKGGTSRTAKPGSTGKIGRPPGQHRKDENQK